MLSILIPVFNYDITELTKEVHKKANASKVEFEIIIIDDASEIVNYKADKIKSLKNVQLIQLRKNIGRSAIRNLLATKAKFENLLFIDAGTFPKSNNFIKNYLNHIDKAVTIGGMTPEEIKPKKPYLLRWKYTKERESNLDNNIATSANFLIKKSILIQHPFDETITTYGYEDLLFFKTLEFNSIKLNFINNPVIHDCREETITFIKKTEKALHNLLTLSVKHKELFQKNKIINSQQKLHKYRFQKVVIVLFRITKPLILKNLSSSNPSIFLLDLYKLGYFCKIKQKQ
jgi:hypothetical protein